MSAASTEGWKLVTQDELLRPDSTVEGLRDLKTPFRPHGKVTAGNASPLTDGATMSLIAGERAVKKLNLKPKMKMLSAASGVRLMTQLAGQFELNPDVRYGMTTMCIGLGMGGTVIWENSNYGGRR